MEYFRIRHTLKVTELGHYPQVKSIKYNCNVATESKFIQHYYFKKINITPCVANPILYSTSKKTDLIERLGIGFSHRLLMSRKLKDILFNYSKDDVQYFQCSIYHKNVEDKNYWIMNPYKFRQEFINFDKSETCLRIRKPEGGTKLIPFDVLTLIEFEKKRELFKKEMSFLNVYTLILENVNKDFFILAGVEGGIGYFVSEKLKNEIENAQCTGIEFQPLDITFNDWLQSRK